jgi:hypothetical protein
MAVQPTRWRGILFTAGVLFLPATGVLVGSYAAYERPPELRQPNELAPSQLGQGFSPQADLPKPAVAIAETRSADGQTPSSIEQKAVLNALEARRLTTQPGMPIERPNRR